MEHSFDPGIRQHLTQSLQIHFLTLLNHLSGVHYFNFISSDYSFEHEILNGKSGRWSHQVYVRGLQLHLTDGIRHRWLKVFTHPVSVNITQADT